MPSPLLSERVSHMLDAIAQIEANMQNLTFEDFQANRFRQDVRARHADIPWRRIGDIGNRLRHAYHAIDSGIIWNIVTNELRELKRSLEVIVRESNK